MGIVYLLDYEEEEMISSGELFTLLMDFLMMIVLINLFIVKKRNDREGISLKTLTILMGLP